MFASMEDELFRKEINLLLSPIYRRKYTYIHVSLVSIFYANFIHASEANTRLTTLNCLSIGTPNTTIFPFVPNGKWWLLGVPIFEHIIIRL